MKRSLFTGYGATRIREICAASRERVAVEEAEKRKPDQWGMVPASFDKKTISIDYTVINPELGKLSDKYLFDLEFRQNPEGTLAIAEGNVLVDVPKSIREEDLLCATSDFFNYAEQMIFTYTPFSREVGGRGLITTNVGSLIMGIPTTYDSETVVQDYPSLFSGIGGREIVQSISSPHNSNNDSGLVFWHVPNANKSEVIEAHLAELNGKETGSSSKLAKNLRGFITRINDHLH